MDILLRKARKFLRSDDGPTATEYAIMLGLIAVAAIIAMGGFGTHVSGIYSYIDTTMPT